MKALDDPEMFPFLEGASIRGMRINATIKRIEKKKVSQGAAGDKMKFVVYFADVAKPVKLNNTSTRRLVRWFGDETDGWAGKSVCLYTKEQKISGETHDVIYVDPFDSRAISASPAKQKLPAAKPPTPPLTSATTDELTNALFDDGNQPVATSPTFAVNQEVVSIKTGETFKVTAVTPDGRYVVGNDANEYTVSGDKIKATEAAPEQPALLTADGNGAYED